MNSNLSINENIGIRRYFVGSVYLIITKKLYIRVNSTIFFQPYSELSWLICLINKITNHQIFVPFLVFGQRMCRSKEECIQQRTVLFQQIFSGNLQCLHTSNCTQQIRYHPTKFANNQSIMNLCLVYSSPLFFGLFMISFHSFSVALWAA